MAFAFSLTCLGNKNRFFRGLRCPPLTGAAMRHRRTNIAFTVILLFFAGTFWEGDWGGMQQGDHPAFQLLAQIFVSRL